MPIEDIASWAENLELVVLPGIETDIASLEQVVQDVALNHNARIDAAQDDADAAQGTANSAISSIYEATLAARVYTDARIQYVLDQIPGIFAGWSDDMTTGITTGVMTGVSAEVAAAVAQATSAAAAAQQVASELGLELDDMQSVASQILDTELPNQQAQIDNAALAAIQGNSTLAMVLEGLNSDSIAEALDLREARLTEAIKPRQRSTLRLPASSWTTESDSLTFFPKLPVPEEQFLTNDPVFGDALDLDGSVSVAIGPAYPMAFEPDKLYQVSARIRVLAHGTTTQACLWAGATTWDNATTRIAPLADIQVWESNNEGVGEEVTVVWYLTADPDQVTDLLNVILLTGSEASQFMFPHFRQQADGSHIRVTWFDVQEISLSRKAWRLAAEAKSDAEAYAGAVAEQVIEVAGYVTAAESYASAAQADRLLAETARTNAVSARDQAVTAQETAAGSASQAYDERVLAAQAASDAGDQVALAVLAQEAAVSAQEGAEGAQVAATLASDLAVRVTSQGSGCLSDQFCPDTWETWTTAPIRQANSIYAAGRELRWNLASAATAAGVRASTSMTTFWRGQKRATGFKIEVEFTLASGSLSGAGILVDFNTSGADNRVAVPFTDMLPQTVIAGQMMLATGEFSIPTGVNLTDVTSMEVFVMANNNASQLGGMAAKDITIHRIQIYPLTFVEAGIIEHRTAIASLQDGASAGYLIKAQAGGEVSLLELIAADGSAGTASVARISADSILLDGSVAMEKLVITDLSGNLVPNGTFAYGDFRGWKNVPSTASIAYINNPAAIATTNSPTEYVLRLATDAAADRAIAVVGKVTAKGGDLFYSRYDLASGGATRDVTIRMQILWYTREGGYISASSVTEANYASTAWYTRESYPVAPAGAAYGIVRILRVAGGAGDAYITNVELVKRRNGATLITPGGITTGDIAAEAITADKVTTGELITRSAQIKNAIINNAKIANLSVDTIKIADDSVTKFDYSFTNGSVTVGGNSTLTLATLVLARSRNQPAVIHGSVTVDFPPNGDGDPAYIQIYDATNGEVVAGERISTSPNPFKVDVFGVDTRTTTGNTTYRLRIVTLNQTSVITTLTKRFIGALNTFK